MASIALQIDSPKPRVEVLAAALGSLGEPLQRCGYKLEAQSPAAIVWRRSGLLGLPSNSRVTMSLTDNTNGGTTITIAGSGPRRLARAFDKL